jgi:hypothetical protein
MYLEEGRRHLRHAQQQYLTIHDPIEALLVAMENDQTILKGSTCRLYKQQHIAIIDEILAGQPDAARRRALSLGRIQVALQRRRGRPPKARTSSLKVTDATKDEAAVLLRYLAKRGRGEANAHLVCMLALYLYFVPRTGCRPIEWSNASVEGTWLVVRNAKNSNGRSGYETRRIGLESFPPKVIEAAAVFARSVPKSISDFKDFAHWRNALAELLARCCNKIASPFAVFLPACGAGHLGEGWRLALGDRSLGWPCVSANSASELCRCPSRVVTSRWARDCGSLSCHGSAAEALGGILNR